jgi:predicted AAA+ superfamily ATPase
MTNPRKIYPVDPGLIPVYDRSGKANLGHALETAVLLELERRGAEVGYVRTASGFEVDFLARLPGGSEQLIQVVAELHDAGTREREIRALLDAKKEHPRARLHLVSLDAQRPRDMPKEVHWHWAPQWLLEATTSDDV